MPQTTQAFARCAIRALSYAMLQVLLLFSLSATTPAQEQKSPRPRSPYALVPNQPRPQPTSPAESGKLERDTPNQLELTGRGWLPKYWAPLPGPETGRLYSMTVKGSRVFVGTEGGVFASDDAGQTWQRSNTGLVGFILSLAASGDTLLAGTDPFTANSLGVWRSTDNGATWEPSREGLPPTAGVGSLAVSGSTVFAALAFSSTVYRSGDNGAHWTLATDALPGPPPGQLPYLSLTANASAVLTPTAEGIYRSTDSGQTWTNANLSLPSGIFANSIAVIGNRFFAGTNGAGILASANAGQTWSPVNNGLPANASIGLLKAAGAVLYCATADGTLYSSANFGATWTLKDRTFALGRNVSEIALSGTNLIAATYDGAIRSTDSGNTWARANAGLRAAGQPGTLLTVGRQIYYTTSGGLWTSHNQGATWTQLNNGFRQQPFSWGNGYSIALKDGALFAGILGPNNTGDGLYRSTNGGSSWEPLSNGISTNFLPATIQPIGHKLYIGSWDGGAYVSNDNGDSWQSIAGLPSDAAFVTFVKSGNTLWAGSYGAGVFRSEDDGVTWQELNEGLDEGSQFVNVIIVSQNMILLGTDAGAFRLRMGGHTWQPLNLGPGGGAVNDLIRVGRTLYAAMYGQGILASTNNGDSWYAVNRGLTTDRFHSFALLGNDLIVSSAGNGAFVLRDVGEDQ